MRTAFRTFVTFTAAVMLLTLALGSSLRAAGLVEDPPDAPVLDPGVPPDDPPAMPEGWYTPWRPSILIHLDLCRPYDPDTSGWYYCCRFDGPPDISGDRCYWCNVQVDPFCGQH